MEVIDSYYPRAIKYVTLRRPLLLKVQRNIAEQAGHEDMWVYDDVFC